MAGLASARPKAQPNPKPNLNLNSAVCFKRIGGKTGKSHHFDIWSAVNHFAKSVLKFNYFAEDLHDSDSSFVPVNPALS